jgi:hypothetical protein
MPTTVRWSHLIAALFALVGIERTLRAAAMVGGPAAPALLFVTIAGEAIGALLAAAGLFLARGRAAVIGLALFAICGVAQMGADLVVYDVRSLLGALEGSALVLAFAALGWLVLEREAAAPPPLLRED